MITTEDRIKEITKGAKQGGESRVVFLEKTNEILKELNPYLNSGNIIFLESRVAETLKNLLKI